ncbi:hypothetical protein TcWFU_010360 [Taenia crassiceps]|uniref:Uncharacterized protein n=1 Tax=Taenia crassiceps TaxID=6207 RepID=A0ABR4QN98_9CEST
MITSTLTCVKTWERSPRGARSSRRSYHWFAHYPVLGKKGPSHSHQRFCRVVASIVLKPLRGRLANEPVRRRGAPTSNSVDGASGPKRRRLMSFNGRTRASVVPTIVDIKDRYADFLSPLPAERDQQSMQNKEKDTEMEDLCQGPSALKHTVFALRIANTIISAKS